MRSKLRVALVAAAIAAVGVAGTAGAAKFITGRDIKNGSVGLVDLSRSTRKALAGRPGPKGPIGPQGPAGAAGAPGATGPSSIATTVIAQSFDALPQDFADGEVRCPDGMVATDGSVSPGALIPVFDAPSSDGRGWIGSAFNSDTTDTFRMDVFFVICTPGSAQVVASAGARTPDSAAALRAAARDAQTR